MSTAMNMEHSGSANIQPVRMVIEMCMRVVREKEEGDFSPKV